MAKLRNLIEYITRDDVLEAAWKNAAKHLPKHCDWKAKRSMAADVAAVREMILSGAIPQRKYKPREYKEGADKKERIITPQRFFPHGIILNAMKLAIEPEIDRRLIYDTSAGRHGKGQVFGALRIKAAIRRHPECQWAVVADLRKCYVTIPHSLVRRSLRKLIADESFLSLFDRIVLDYHDDSEELLREEYAKKMRCCAWASREPFDTGGVRGLCIGGTLSQLLENLILNELDHFMIEAGAVGYHRHCDNFFFLAHSKAEARALLTLLDAECNKLGLCLKHDSFYAQVPDRKLHIKGRAIDILGYVFTRDFMKMRKRNKKHFARSMKRVKSARRRREICAAYYGIAKWGNCRNLWRCLTKRYNMAFKDFNIITEDVSRDKSGRRIFNVPERKQSEIAADGSPIWIHDFEAGLTINGKPDRCSVLYSEHSCDGPRRKFITSSALIINKLRRATELEENEGCEIFPQETVLRQCALSGGRYTYDID